jgi:hypothetical protein
MSVSHLVATAASTFLGFKGAKAIAPIIPLHPATKKKEPPPAPVIDIKTKKEKK